MKTGKATFRPIFTRVSILVVSDVAVKSQVPDTLQGIREKKNPWGIFQREGQLCPKIDFFQKILILRSESRASRSPIFEFSKPVYFTCFWPILIFFGQIKPQKKPNRQCRKFEFPYKSKIRKSGSDALAAGLKIRIFWKKSILGHF